GRMAIDYVVNPEYTRGSVLSLYAARQYLREPALVMDADVLFPREFLRRLLAAPSPSALLLDRGFADTGEEVKLYTRGDRVIALGKKVVPEAWDIVGEGVGFFKCGAEAGPAFVRFLERVLEENQGMNEYEDALHMLVTSHHVGWVDVTGLRWTEIDFAEDLRRAEADVLAPPAGLAALRAAGPGAVLAASTREGAPVLVADAALAAALAPALAEGTPLGDDLDRALKSRDVRAVAEGWYVLARDARGVAEAEARLYAALGSPIDTRLDVVLHRRLSFHVTRAAVWLGVTPNAISVASFLVG